MDNLYKVSAKLPELNVPNFIIGVLMLIIIQLIFVPYVKWIAVVAFWVWVLVQFVAATYP